MEGVFTAGAVLITMGAFLGKCSLMQLFGMANLKVFFYTLKKSYRF
jgi:hypothetical protein